MFSVRTNSATAIRRMRGLLFILIPAALLSSSSAWAAVQITIDKNSQTMLVAVDGAQMYRWPVSSGLPAHETPNGSFKAFRMEEDHYSKEWDDAPMPHSIFFTARGHAIHGTDSVSRLGSPASHGCVRLSRANAATLYALVQREGVLNTTVTLSGSSQVALARPRANQPRQPQDVAINDPNTPTINAPLPIAPRQPQAQVYGGDGYVTTDRQTYDRQMQQARRVYRTPEGEYYYAQPTDQTQQSYQGNYVGDPTYAQPTYQQPRRYYYRY